MKLKVPISLFLIIAISACGSLRKATLNNDNQDIIKDQIVFHDFFAWNASGKVDITERERVLADGKIKEVPVNPQSLMHPVEIVFLDKSGKRIKSTFIENPLIKEYEYADDGGNLKRIVSYEDSTIFTIRYNLIDNLHSMNFSSVSNDTLPIQVHLKLEK